MPRTFTCEVDGRTYRYRGSTRRELEEALRLGGERDDLVEDELVRTCLLDPDGPTHDWGRTPAGLVTTLANAIREVSGLTAGSIVSLKREAETWLSSEAGQAEALMMGVLGVSLEAVQALEPHFWFKSALAARHLFEMQMAMNAPAAPAGPMGAVVPPGQAPVARPARGQKASQVEKQIVLGSLGPPG